MKKFLSKILVVIVAAFMLITAVGCSYLEGLIKTPTQKPSQTPTTNFPKLPAPEVTIDSDGVASWEKVDGAIYYAYVIDVGDEMLTDEYSVLLKENESIKVKAISGSSEYDDSAFSEIKTYIKGSVQTTKLATPQVSISSDGIAAWGKITNAQYYVYVIDNGAEIKTSECSVKLTENQSIKVKAASDDAKYTESNFSQSKTYIKTVVPPDTHKHTDANSDGTCDTCKNSVMAELSFYAVNDLHGKFMDTSTQPGVDEFTTYLKNLYKDTKREEILLSSGDMWQGTVESSSNQGQLMTEWMNDVGFASMTLGNHEYDWGPAVLTPNSKLADFPFLAINVTYNGKAVDYCKASTTVEKAGVKIGIIGAIGDCLTSISSEVRQGLSFATGDALTSLVKKEATRLRNQEGCDFIVYSIHDGGDSFSASGVNSVSNSDMDYYDASLSDGYVDLVFEAHTHQRYILKDEYGVYHLQGGSENKYLSCAEVSYNTVTGKYTVNPSHLGTNVYANSSLTDDPVVNELYKKYFPNSNPYAVIGTNSSQRNSKAICEKVAELYYEKGREIWSQYDVVLGGGYLNARNPYNVYAGNVTYADLFSVMPFNNDIVLGKISGTYLKSQFLENSKYTNYTTLSSSGVSNSKDYYIVVDTYTSTYYANHITQVARLEGVYARDLLADFVSKGGWGTGTKSTTYYGNLSQDFKSLTGYAL